MTVTVHAAAPAPATKEGSAERQAPEITILDPSFSLAMSSFQGPLDLLLHLIKQHELDILDVPVAFVARRYGEYIKAMEALNLDIASEYLVMAATLAYIKSRSLLPEDPTEQDEDAEEEEVDPRAALIARLLEYQKYKAAAASLDAMPRLYRDTFPRPWVPSLTAPGTDEDRIGEVSSFSLLAALKRVLERTQNEQALTVSQERITIQARMRELVDRLNQTFTAHFDDLFAGAKDVYDVVVTFLALLELTKMKLCTLRQGDYRAPLVVSLIAPMEGEGPDLHAVLPSSDAGDVDEPPPVATLASEQADATEDQFSTGPSTEAPGIDADTP